MLELIGLTRQSDDIWTDGDGVLIQIVESRPGTRPYDRYAPGLNHIGFGAPDVAFVERVRVESEARRGRDDSGASRALC